MLNKDTWDFAHKFCGNLWCLLGWFTFISSAIAVAAMFVLRLTVETVSVLGAVAVLLQLIPLIAALPITERALKLRFKI